MITKKLYNKNFIVKYKYIILYFDLICFIINNLYKTLHKLQWN